MIMTSLDKDSDGRQNSFLTIQAESFESGPGSDCRCTPSRSQESQRTYFYDSDSFLSIGSTELDSESQNTTTPSVEGYENDDFELYDEKESMLEEELRGKWIRILRARAPPSSILPRVQRSNCSVQTGGGRLCLEEHVALKAFCREKIRRAQALQQTSPPTRWTRSGRQTVSLPEMAEPQADCLVPEQFVSVLRLRRFTEEMKKAVGTELHQPSHCGPCQETLARFAKDTFFQRKRGQLESLLLQDKLQAHLFEKDAICLFGELLSNIPSVSDDPNKTWQELLSNGHWTPE